MTREEAIALLRSHIAEIRRFGVQSLSLFGSLARGDARADSDVDVLADFGPNPTLEGYVGLTMFLEELFGRRVDVLTPGSIKPRVRPLIERDLIHVA